MKRLRLFWVLVMLLVSSAGARAQWTGNVDAAGGFGLMKGMRTMTENGSPLYHYLGKGAADITYKDSLVTWKTILSGSYESVNKDQLQGESHYFDEDVTVDALLTLSEEQPLTTRFRSEAIWQRPSGRMFSAWIQYQLDHNYAYNVNTQFDQTLNMSIYADEATSFNHDAGTGLTFSRPLGSSRRILAGSLSYGLVVSDKTTEYYAVKYSDPDNIWADVFRLTPHSSTNRAKGILHYRDSVLTGNTKLILDPGLRVTANASVHKNSGATASGALSEHDDYIWRDSTAIREHFHFLSMDIQPYLALDLSGSKIRLHTDYALMLYSRQLTDESHKQGLQIQRPYAVGNGYFTWEMGTGHKLTLTNALTVRHPSYLQVCWYDRSAGYIDRLYRGNPDLKSNVVRGYGLNYTFRHKRFLVSSAVTFIRSRNEIVQTWFHEVIDGREYHIFTWINGADSRIWGFEQKLGWNGKILTAGLDAAYNHGQQKLTDTDEAVHADDWSLSGNISANLGKGWTVSADAKYQSEVASFFAMFSDYCRVNAKVAKAFKKWTIYLEGRDLADTPHIVRVESADGTLVNVERSYRNRRLIVLGCKWNF